MCGRGGRRLEICERRSPTRSYRSGSDNALKQKSVVPVSAYIGWPHRSPCSRNKVTYVPSTHAPLTSSPFFLRSSDFSLSRSHVSFQRLCMSLMVAQSLRRMPPASLMPWWRPTRYARCIDGMNRLYASFQSVVCPQAIPTSTNINVADMDVLNGFLVIPSSSMKKTRGLLHSYLPNIVR